MSCFRGDLHPAQVLRCIESVLPREAVVEIVTPIPRKLKGWLTENALRGPIFHRGCYRFLNEEGVASEAADLIATEADRKVCVYIFAYVGRKDVLYWEVGYGEINLGHDVAAKMFQCLAEVSNLAPFEESNGERSAEGHQRNGT